MRKSDALGQIIQVALGCLQQEIDIETQVLESK